MVRENVAASYARIFKGLLYPLPHPPETGMVSLRRPEHRRALRSMAFGGSRLTGRLLLPFDSQRLFVRGSDSNV